LVGTAGAPATNSRPNPGDKRRPDSSMSPRRPPVSFTADVAQRPQPRLNHSETRQSPRLIRRRLQSEDPTMATTPPGGRLIEGRLGSVDHAEPHRRDQRRTSTECTARPPAQNLWFLAHRKFKWGNGVHSSSFYNVISLSVMARMDAGELVYSKTSDLARRYFSVLQSLMEGLDAIPDRNILVSWLNLNTSISTLLAKLGLL